MHARAFRLALAAACTTVATTADAQIIRIPQRSREPALWTQLSVGMAQIGAVPDGRTGTVWGFSDGLHYRGTLEYDLRRGTSVGVAVAHAPGVAMTYDDPDGCGRCDGSAAVTSVTALVHAGGTTGLHQVLELQAGVTRYHGFEIESAAATPPPAADTDFAIGLTYGFGFALSPRWQVSLVQDAFQVFHQRDGLSGGTRANVAHYVTRLAVRYGLATRRPGL